MDAVEVPAVGTCGALSEARHVSRCCRTSSTQFTQRKIPPFESASTCLSCLADARPQLTCNFKMVFLRSDELSSHTSPRVTAVLAEKSLGGAKRSCPSFVKAVLHSTIQGVPAKTSTLDTTPPSSAHDQYSRALYQTRLH